MKSDKLIGLAALDVQIKYPQFQKYKPENFSKNLSRVKLELGLREAAAGAAEAPSVVATAVGNSGGDGFPMADTTSKHITKRHLPFNFVDLDEFPEGVMEMKLPGSLEEWFDGKYQRLLA